MKLKNILIVCLLAGCTSKTSTPKMSKTDSLMITSDSIMIKADNSGKALDSVTTVTAQKVIGNVNELTQTINSYQNQLKTATKVKTVDRIIHDTVYIETKKSFWGKTKKTVTAKSDRTVNQTEVTDSL